MIGGTWLLAVVFGSLVIPFFYGIPYDRIDVLATFAKPSPAHWLGTDENGRDVFSRLLYGGRISLIVGATAAAIAISLGTVIGAVAGNFGGRLDALLMRVTDTFMSVPIFFVLLLLLTLFGGELTVLVIGIGITSWMGVSRIVRGEVLRFRVMEFVLAARAVGASEMRLLWRHLVPQAIPSIIVASTLGVAQAILAETAFSYLGLGIRPPLPSWGNMLSGAQNYLFMAQSLAIYPGLAILLTVLALNVLGDGLRDALDPQLVEQAQ